MSKKGIAGITGNTNPVVGKAEAYKVATVYPDTTIKDYNEIKWVLFKKVDGKWVKLNGSEKTGLSVEFTFSELSLNKEILVEAYINTPEASSPPGLILKPTQAQEPSFTKLEVLDSSGNTPKEKFSYGQTLNAKATCVGMEGESVTFQLWEDDAPGSGHNEDNKKSFCDNQNQIVKKGIATASFLLKPDFVRIANAYLYPGDTNEGETHEYYVTVQSTKTYLASSNTDVKNPDYIPPTKPKPEQTTPAAPTPPDPVPVPVKPDLKPDPAPKPTNSPVVVGNKPKDKNGCPNCDKDISVAELKKVYKDAKDSLLSELATSINKYRKKFGLDTCARKAHFFAQSLQEVSTTLAPGLEGESMNYAATALPATFIKFSKTGKLGGPPNDLAFKYGRTKEHKANQPMIANIAYNGRLGNKNDSEDGWNFRGRGLLQITGRSNYAEIQKAIDLQYPGSGVNVSEGTAGSYTPEQAAITGLADWYKDKMFLKADLSNQGASDDAVVDAIVNIINRYTNSRPQRKVWYRGGKAGDLSVSSANSMKSIFQVNACNGEKPKTEIVDNKPVLTGDADIEYHIQSSSGEIKYKINNEKRETAAYTYYDKDGKSHKIGKYSLNKVRDQYKRKIYLDPINQKSLYLFNMKQILGKGFSSGELKFKIKKNTVRMYLNDVTLAALFGSMLDCGYTDFAFNGGSGNTGETNAPSVSHCNGMHADFTYLRKDKSGSPVNLKGSGWKVLDEERQNKFHDALYKYGWKDLLSWKFDGRTLNHAKHATNHEHHLHAQIFKPKLTKM